MAPKRVAGQAGPSQPEPAKGRFHGDEYRGSVTCWGILSGIGSNCCTRWNFFQQFEVRKHKTLENYKTV